MGILVAKDVAGDYEHVVFDCRGDRFIIDPDDLGKRSKGLSQTLAAGGKAIIEIATSELLFYCFADTDVAERIPAGNKPAGIKLCVGHAHEVFAIMKAMLDSGVLLDFIVVDGGEGGTGAAPQEFSNRVGMPLREGLTLVRNAIVGCGLSGKVRLSA